MDYFAALDSWVDISYIHQGHSRCGVDCIGLVRAVYAEFGIDLSQHDIPERALKPNQRQLLMGLAKAFPNRDRIGAGTVLGIRNPMTGFCHVTLYRAKMKGVYEVIEACRERGRVVKNYYDANQAVIYSPSADQFAMLAQQTNPQ